MTRRVVLTPFDVRHAFSIAEAAAIAGRTPGTIRAWCANFDLGRRVGGTTWWVSRVALHAYLDGDQAALEAYWTGDLDHAALRPYTERLGLCLTNT